jgi:hypothetical protein
MAAERDEEQNEKRGLPDWFWWLCLLGLIGLFVLAWTSMLPRRVGTPSNPVPSQTIDPPSTPEKEPSSIGVATLEEDGTIHMILNVGTTEFSYPPDHKDYKYILKHLGGLKKGETKSVPPFPDSP